MDTLPAVDQNAMDELLQRVDALRADPYVRELERRIARLEAENRIHRRKAARRRKAYRSLQAAYNEQQRLMER